MSGMDRLTEEQMAAYAHVDSVIKDAQSFGGGYLWHGWSIREAFLAGAAWEAHRRTSQASPGPSDGLLTVVARVEGSPEWHLAKVLGYICSDPSALRGLGDNDTLSMDVFVRVGDIRAAYSSLIQTFGSDGNEEARWTSDVENNCPHCGGSGHKDDAAPSDGLREAVDAAWNDAIEAAADEVARYMIGAGVGSGPFHKLNQEIAEAIRALRRAARTEGEA